MMRVLNPVIIPAVHQDTFVQHLLYLRHYLLWGIFREKRKSEYFNFGVKLYAGKFCPLSRFEFSLKWQWTQLENNSG